MAREPWRDRSFYSNGGGEPWHSTALSEYEPGFLNGLRRSVNRKVVGLYRETNGALRIARVLYLCMAQSP